MNYKDLLTRVLEAEIVWAFSKRLRLIIRDFTIISGLQYTFGRNKNMEQIISYTEPVEYN